MALVDDILSGNWMTGLAIGCRYSGCLAVARPYPPAGCEDCDQERHSGLSGRGWTVRGHR
jgi:hypothetical protein